MLEIEKINRVSELKDRYQQLTQEINKQECIIDNIKDTIRNIITEKLRISKEIKKLHNPILRKAVEFYIKKHTKKGDVFRASLYYIHNSLGDAIVKYEILKYNKDTINIKILAFPDNIKNDINIEEYVKLTKKEQQGFFKLTYDRLLLIQFVKSPSSCMEEEDFIDYLNGLDRDKKIENILK